MPEPSKFKVGDVVREVARDKGTVWMVEDDDTNQTPVHDPEPAYKLRRRAQGACGEFRIRYAYESQLRLATA